VWVGGGGLGKVAVVRGSGATSREAPMKLKGVPDRDDAVRSQHWPRCSCGAIDLHSIFQFKAGLVGGQ
jgi:hypothetical protein